MDNISQNRLERKILKLEHVIEMYTDMLRHDQEPRGKATMMQARAQAVIELEDLLAEKERRHRVEFHEFQTALRGRQPRLPRSVIEQIGRELYKM